MSSFIKSSDTRVTISGTKLKNNLPYISSGIPSLDFVIGGGLPSGSIFVVEEDILANYSRVLIKYFLAEGITCRHALLIASADEDPNVIAKELPQSCSDPQDDEVTNVSSNVDKMKIAWRYEGLKQVESSFGNSSNFGHYFNLSKHIDSDVINNNDITYCNLNTPEDSCKGFKNGLYYKLLNEIKILISKDAFKIKNQNNSNILRISIQSLGSSSWMAMDCGDDVNAASYGQDLMKFMYYLRIIVRDTNAVVFVTIPSHLFEDEHIMKRLLYSVDNGVRIESFAGSSRETNPVFKDYHGLFHITKLSSLYSLVPFVPPSLDLAFKLKRKKFLIEKLHIPPELEETSEREQDDIVAAPNVSCGGFKKKDIDF